MSTILACPYCDAEAGSRVVDTDQCSDGILRTRICFGCHMPFRTTETIDRHEPDDLSSVEPQPEVVDDLPAAEPQADADVPATGTLSPEKRQYRKRARPATANG